MTTQVKGRAIIAEAIKLLAKPENLKQDGWTADGTSDLRGQTCLCAGAALIKAAGFTNTTQRHGNYYSSYFVLYQPPFATVQTDHFARVCHIARLEAKERGFTSVPDLNDRSDYATVLDFLKSVQKRVNADPWFRRSSVRIAGNERFYQRSRRALRKAQANAQPAA